MKRLASKVQRMQSEAMSERTHGEFTHSSKEINRWFVVLGGLVTLLVAMDSVSRVYVGVRETPEKVEEIQKEVVKINLGLVRVETKVDSILALRPSKSAQTISFTNLPVQYGQ